MKYVDVVIDNRSDFTDMLYTYMDPDDVIEPGMKIEVPFGRKNSMKTAYVVRVREVAEKTDEKNRQEIAENIKNVGEIQNDMSLVPETVDTAMWMKKRYLAKAIDCIRLFLPAGSAARRRRKKETVRQFEGEEQNIENLTDEQRKAVAAICSGRKGQVFLLQGVTGSGKTEVYMRCCADALEHGKTAVIIVPEVSLTKQITDRFVTRFGYDKIAVMHSRMTAGERYDQWKKIRDGEVSIVIGARSAVFAPLENIGLIVIDEEHEGSYKSHMSPKYETWEVAARRASWWGAKVVLGSGTPSIDSLYRAEKGEFTRLKLTERYNGVPLPEVEIADMRAEMRSGNRTVFSRSLYDGIRNTLDKGGQVILFINRRGYSSHVFCRECGYVAECDMCGVPLTFHRSSNAMVCHYCGRKSPPPDTCPSCGSRYIRYFGAGTQQIEEAAARMFPDASVARLDVDTGKNAGEINRILSDFAKGRTDILVGTQLVGKGIDNRNVDLVGIMAIDTVLSYPDYRSAENCFQLITQAAGRAGRGENRGKVVVQTYQPDAYPVRMGAVQDADGFYSQEIKKRKMLDNPPFSTMVQIRNSGPSGKEDEVEKIASEWVKRIGKLGGKGRVLGRKRKRTEKEFQIFLLIKITDGAEEEFRQIAAEFREELRETKNRCSSIADFNPENVWRYE